VKTLEVWDAGELESGREGRRPRFVRWDWEGRRKRETFLSLACPTPHDLKPKIPGKHRASAPLKDFHSEFNNFLESALL